MLAYVMLAAMAIGLALLIMVFACPEVYVAAGKGLVRLFRRRKR